MTSVYEQKPWLSTYPEWMPSTLTLPQESILDVFEENANKHPDSPCLCYFDKSYSFFDIRQMSQALSHRLQEHGVSKGDRVVCDLQNIPQMIIACLAIWMRGAIVVPINPMYIAKDLKYYLEDSEASLVICEDYLYESVISQAVREYKDIPVIVTSPLDFLGDEQSRPPQLESREKMNFEKTEDLIDVVQRADPTRLTPQKPHPEDLAYLVYTSGTTGPPKGAMLTHANMVHNAKIYEVACRLGKKDAILGVAPMFHVTGIVAHMVTGFYLGIPTILFHRFDPEDALHLIQKWNVTFTVAPITIYIALLNHSNINQYDLSSFKKPYSGGAPVSPGIVDKFYKATNAYIYNVYGLTESSSPATITPLGFQAPVDSESGALSVGLIVPGHEAWIMNVEDPSKEMPIGQEGELVLRGPGITQGYWKKPEESSHAIKNGCFYTGDVAIIDEKGWCYIVDRKKDLINVSGFKVWPREVEDVLYEHPGVSEAAVVGIPDSYRGENVKAFVSLNLAYKNKVSPEEIVKFCKERLAAYKYPRHVEIIDEVPKTKTGKFLRKELRNR